MTFEEWHEEQNKPYDSHACPHYEWEKLAWNAAIKAATEKVRENYDELEPWITPEEIEELTA